MSPYIVTTKQRITHPREGMDATFVLSRVAVGTLVDAQSKAHDTIFGSEAKATDCTGMDVRYHPAYEALENLPNSGGTITLPDGTVIEVEQTTWRDLVRGTGLRVAWVGDVPPAADQQRILDVFNAQER